MIKLSVVIITLNEEKNIGRCLESIKNIADEIVIVDSYSRDETKNICLQHKVKFIECEWKGYTGTKNYANSLATGEYILSIDADEALSKALEKSIMDFKQTPIPNAVFQISRLTNFCGTWIKHAGWYPDRKIRIWKANTAKWEGQIHEQLEYDENYKTIQLEGDLLHYSFYSVSQHLKTIDNFTSISAQERFAKGKRTNVLKIIFKPIFKFFVLYIIKFGFLDGFYGYIVCKNSAFSTYLNEVKQFEIKHNKNKFK